MARPTHLERTAVLETQVQTLQTSHESIDAKLDVLMNAYTKHQTLIGVFVFLATGVWAGVVAFKDNIIGLFR